jgi:membrane-bound lytic murein transglycosylase MltF
MVLTSRRSLIAATALNAFAAPRSWPQTPQAVPAGPEHPTLSLRDTRFTGDFDQMLDRRRVRVVVPYSRTLFFVDKGALYGTTADGVQLLQEWFNRTFKLGARPLTVRLIPTSRDKLFDSILAGDGDIAAGDITVTEERQKRVAFTAPILSNVREIVLTDDKVPDLESAEALSGKKVATRRSTSYYESLTKLNDRLVALGKPTVTIQLVPDTLESEDLMEMTAAGLLPAVVVDDWIARLWVQIIKGLKLHPKAALREGGQIAWAVRPDNPKLLATLNRAITAIDGNALQWMSHTKAYLAKLKQLHTASKGADMQRFRDTLEIFRTYANQYQFDTLLLLAQGYQESRLDQNARSPFGAIGIMQVMPQTGQILGVGDIHKANANVHAGTKYIAQLMDVYFAGIPFDEQNRTLFALAAYNAGPGRIRSLRREAEAQKLDPNVWFDNVERVAALHVGQEPVRYVRNIYKYYIPYKLIQEDAAVDEAARSMINAPVAPAEQASTKSP